jgi:probable phosphoglycerate mutase
MLATLEPDLIISSDLSRARETAEILAGLTDCEVLIDPSLRETYAGGWEGLTDVEIRAQFADEWAAWRRGEVIRRGGGELDDEVVARVTAAIERALEKIRPTGTLVVVSHGGAGRLAIAGLLGLPKEHWSALGALANVRGRCSARTPGWRLNEHNAGTPRARPRDDCASPGCRAEGPAPWSLRQVYQDMAIFPWLRGSCRGRKRRADLPSAKALAPLLSSSVPSGVVVRRTVLHGVAGDHCASRRTATW